MYGENNVEMNQQANNHKNDVNESITSRKPQTRKTYRTASGRLISYYGCELGETIVSTSCGTQITLSDFFEILLKSWGKESAYPSAQEDSVYCLANDPTYGQCAVTAMLVNKFFGGEIRKLWVSGGGTHYFNIINGKIIDLTREQFDLYSIPLDYSEAVNVPLQYCGKNPNTRARLDVLEKNVFKNIEWK